MKRLSCIVLAVILMAGLCGCSSIDPVKAVDDSMKLAFTGEVTDDLVAMTGETREELQELYEDMYNELIEDVFDAVGESAYTEDVGKEAITNYVNATLSTIKYEVSDEYTEADGTYYVDVTVYPPLWAQSAEDYIMGEFLDEWESKILNGQYTLTTESQLMVDMYNDLFNKLADQAKNTEYGDPETVEIRVEPDGDYYTVNEDDIDRMALAVFPTY